MITEGNIKPVRVAIYTRKSNEKGLDQALTSLHVQRGACEAFVSSRSSKGWIALPTIYEDGGYSGGTNDRPGLQRLLSDVREKKVDVVACYKYDRLSRDVILFGRLLQEMNEHNVEFISATESFDTTTSLGRAFTTVLMSFNQYQREDARDRVNLKFKSMAERGMWVYHNPIIGYDIINKELIPCEEEREQAIEQFTVYRDAQSLLAAAEVLAKKGYRLKRWTAKNGKPKGGSKYTAHNLQRLLRNPMYIGKVRFQDTVYAGKHAAVVPEPLFKEVQDLLSRNGAMKNSLARGQYDFWLKAILECAVCKGGMTMNFSYSKGRVYFYYRCVKTLHEGKKACSVGSVSAPAIHDAVLKRIAFLGENEKVVAAVLDGVKAEGADKHPAVLTEAKRLERTLAQIDRQVTNLIDLASEGGADMPSVRAKIKDMESQKVKLRGELEIKRAEAESLQRDVPPPEEVCRMLKDLPKVMNALPENEKRILASLILKRVVYDEPGQAVNMELQLLPGLDPAPLSQGFETNVKRRRGWDSNPRRL